MPLYDAENTRWPSATPCRRILIPLFIWERTEWEMPGNKHPAPLQSWQDGERGQLPSGQAQTPSPSTIPIKPHDKDMKPLSFPLCEQPSQPSSPTPEPLSANPHIWLSWNPAVPEQLITPTKGTEGLPKKPLPSRPAQWVDEDVHIGGWQCTCEFCTPVPRHTHQEELHMCVWLWYGWQWCFTGQGRLPQADCTSSPLLPIGFAPSPLCCIFPY